MPTQVLINNKLATLSEFRYLLLEVLDREDPISWYDLSFSCKEMSLNFAFAFENSMNFLNLVSLVQINSERSVARREHNYRALDSEKELAVFIMQKTVEYLKTNELFELVFNKNILTTGVTSDAITLNVNELPANVQFMSTLMLNLGIIIPDKNEKTRFLVDTNYEAYFRDELLPKILEKPLIKGKVADTSGKAQIPTFFISYADKDREFKDELQNHLSGLKRNNEINDWEGRAILPGQDWDDEIRQKLEQAKVVLFLVSSDFLASDYIHDVEIEKTIERHRQGLVKIIPIIVRPCDFDSLPINRYQALPDRAKAVSLWENKDAAYLNIVNGIKAVIKSLSKQ